MYFLRTSWGASYSIPIDAELYLGDMSKVESFWFGKDGAWVAIKFDGSRCWDLKGHYSGMIERLRNALNGETEIQVSASIIWNKSRLTAYRRSQ